MKKINLPKRVMITGGMPNGNKPLHLGHISYFIVADAYARYMRDRIGEENVLFLSGTDGFGSSTDEKYRKLKAKGEINETLPEYITRFHNIQQQTFQQYKISLNEFYASCLEPALPTHIEVSKYIFETLLKNGKMQKKETEQFYDTQCNVFLNGRQVEGKCPIEGCESEEGYADECSLGHQYNPRELIDPKSMLSGTTPIFKKTTNYYFSLDEYRENLLNIVQRLKDVPRARKFMLKEMRDYLTRPAIYLSLKDKERYDALNITNVFEIKVDEKKNRLEIITNNIKQRDDICEILNKNDIHFKTNKSLAPLRITGNAEWGVPVPQIEPETKGLTFYVWPESLWAPISFTQYYLNTHKTNNPKWKDWWCNKDCDVVQFIGEDNIYFYCLAQQAIFMALNGSGTNENPVDGELQMTNVIPAKHILWYNIKASSSGSKAAPTTANLLEHYTVEQLRCHFLAMNVHNSAYDFKSKVFQPEEYQNCGDPAVAQGNMLTNIFNRLIRSVLYSYQSMLNNELPTDIKPSQKVIDESVRVAEIYQDKMAEIKTSEIMILLDEYFRNANQEWSVRSKNKDVESIKQLIADTLHVIKTGITLLHPIAPDGVALVMDYLKADNKLFNWDNIEKTFFELYPDTKCFKFLEPQFDFFKKHETQI